MDSGLAAARRPGMTACRDHGYGFEFQTANAISIVTVIASASEAIHRWRSELESWIASSLSLLAMTSRHGFAISRREAPE
jgi:hypothetical protein